jgi:FRG domain
MKGQWVGDYQGSNIGKIIINVDELSNSFKGVAYINDENSDLPSSAIAFETPNKNRSSEFEVKVFPINPQTGMADNWQNIQRLFNSNIIFPTDATVTIKWNYKVLKISWKTSINTFGVANLPKSQTNQPSILSPLKKNWSSYKKFASEIDHRKYIFRGQNKPWRLRTSFHRHGRSDLVRFISEDISTLHKHLSARTKHIFNLQIPDENGAFFNFVQHHGYPTPLLDWTYSPYVAAYFAYRGITSSDAKKANKTDRVRIHVLDQTNWQKDFIQLKQLATSNLHFSINEFMAIENERMIPQQAISSVTNIDDIETYIKQLESNGKTYLQAIDLPVKERDQVLMELQYMGITSGSLFPGYDGTCEEFKERLFKI